MNITSTRLTSTRLRFCVTGMPSETAARLRHALVDDFGNPIRAWVCDYAAPCRHCLRLSTPGERLLVLAYRPFETDGPYAEIGPIFIHADACPAYEDRQLFPEDFRPRQLVMRGYNERGTIEAAELSEPGKPEDSLERLLTNERVLYVHVRNPAFGCYDFRVELSDERF